MNIIIDIHDIRATGGIENVISCLANAMVRRGYKVTCFTYSPIGTPSRFCFDSAVQFEHYVFTGDASTLPKLKEQLLRCQPDVFISPASFNNSLLWCSVLKDLDIPLIYSEHTDPWIIENKRWNQKERQAVLWAADAVHLLLPPFFKSVPEQLQSKCHIIGNPVPPPPPEFQGNAPHPAPCILSLGRLNPVKQIPLLVEAFDIVAKDFPQWELHIWGIGEEENRIRQTMSQTTCAGRIHLCGLTRTPHEQFSQADIFCIPSRYEGFGLTIIEAFTHGVPVVGFQTCSAVNYLIKDEVNGVLSPAMTAASLAQSLRRLMEDKQLRQRLGQAALATAQEYTPERIYDQWEELIQIAVARKGQSQLSRLNQDETLSPEEEAWRNTMREIVQRPNVLLQNRQIFRRFLRRHPKLKNFIKSIVNKITSGKKA